MSTSATSLSGPLSKTDCTGFGRGEMADADVKTARFRSLLTTHSFSALLPPQRSDNCRPTWFQQRIPMTKPLMHQVITRARQIIDDECSWVQVFEDGQHTHPHDPRAVSFCA